MGSSGWGGLVLVAGLLAPAPPPAPPTLYPHTIVLLRHGHYAPAPEGAPERPGPGLTPLGVAQARLAGGRLAGMHFDALLASPLTRAQETARVVAEDLRLPVQVVDELQECTPRTWRTAVVADEKPADMAACAATLDRVFAEQFKPATGAERRDLLVCHGNVIRYLVTKALKVDPQAWLEMSVGHASLTTIRVEKDGSTRVIAVGDVGHLPPNLQTGSIGNPERTLSVP
jgi:serine/threonine-protein phosphatase PGAM5